MKIALICGGPSPERGISLNSARSVLDHLSAGDIKIVPIYFNLNKKAYEISPAQLYSNTPADFDFKLKQTAKPLTAKSLVAFFKKTDIAFPVMHGLFGEDGGIQNFLEKNKIPFVGSSAKSCRLAFDKYDSNEFIKKHGFFALPSIVLEADKNNHFKITHNFFRRYKIKRAAVKPAIGGSSIGVFSVNTPYQALTKADFLFSKKIYKRVVIEQFAQGREFTVIILENKFGLPVALPPTEIETDYTKHQIFDYRKKYLPTRQVTWHCPPRFSDKIIEKIEAQAEQLFRLFNMRDFARFDGWVLPDGNIWFCDFNPISGMEQNSFLFQQASRIGYTHTDILRHILANACRRYGLKFPEKKTGQKQKRKPLPIIFGGGNSERQVSLMSGTNVWLKLRSSKIYEPSPYLLDKQGNVWKLPYNLALNHTVEEIVENCQKYDLAKKRLASFEQRVRLRLGIQNNENNEFFEPKKMTLNQLVKNTPFLFLALHGGRGEDGTMQKYLSARKVKFNGPDTRVSRLCMNKYAAAEFIKKLKIKGIINIPRRLIATRQLLTLKNKNIKNLWQKITAHLGAPLIIKPIADGCSAGVVRLNSEIDLIKYRDLLARRAPFIPKNTFLNQNNIIEMPPLLPNRLLLEKFIITDELIIKGSCLKHIKKSGWLEITIGVIEKSGKIRVLNPSITVAEGDVLSVEEKFQGGTGINITPPPENIMPPPAVKKTKHLIKEVAIKIGIKGYCRIDAFVHLKTGNLMVIEINTLPALTPSTVFYHQALAEKPPIFPKELLQILIRNKNY